MSAKDAAGFPTWVQRSTMMYPIQCDRSMDSSHHPPPCKCITVLLTIFPVSIPPSPPAHPSDNQWEGRRRLPQLPSSTCTGPSGHLLVSEAAWLLQCSLWVTLPSEHTRRERFCFCASSCLSGPLYLKLRLAAVQFHPGSQTTGPS